MKRYTILIIFLLVGLIVKSQYRGQYFEALNYFELGDSTVTVWGKDTLTNPAMVRQIIDDANINSDSALWADTSGYALNVITPQSGIWFWNVLTSLYEPYSSFQANSWYYGTTNPSGTIRLNWDGLLYLNGLISYDRIASNSTTNNAIEGTSSLAGGSGIYGNSTTGSGGAFQQNGFTGGNSYPLLRLERTLSGTSASGDIINVIDNPTTSSISGAVLSATIDGTERISLNPRASNNSYLFDTDDPITGGYHTTWEVQGTEIMNLYNNGFLNLNGVRSLAESEAIVLNTSGEISFNILGFQKMYVDGNNDSLSAYNLDASFNSVKSKKAILDIVETDTAVVGGDTATGFIDLKEAVEAESFDKLQFNQTGQSYSEGTLFYDSTEKSISFYNNISGFKEEFGRGVNIRFYNNTGSLITNGSVIRSVGVHKNSAINFLGDLAGNASLDSILGVAVATVDVPDGEHGMATVLGQVNGLNTSMYSDNDIIYVGHAGAFTNVPPEAPLWYQILGRVVYADNDSGAIYIKTGETKYSPAPTFTARFEDSTETITNPGLDVYELITSATNSLFEEKRNVGFTFQGDSISPKQDGNYTIFLSYSFQGTASQTDLYRIGTFIDGVKEYSTSRTASGTNNGGVPYPVTVFLTAGQWISFRIKNEISGTRDCVFTDGTITINYAE